MVSGDAGVLALHRIASMDRDDQSVDLDAYYKNLNFEHQFVGKYPMHMYFADMLAAIDSKGREVTRIKARDARNLLKILQKERS